MTSRFTVSKTEKNLLADDASAERGYGSTGRGSTSGYEDADFHGNLFAADLRAGFKENMLLFGLVTYSELRFT